MNMMELWMTMNGQKDMCKKLPYISLHTSENRSYHITHLKVNQHRNGKL